mmetsp:Transcript_5511/g.15335  ORF Transcript_5511/g.15335 Transcript_5511/m.15335 type:complete len:176 (+) Transcript_5511:760-1287(+)
MCSDQTAFERRHHTAPDGSSGKRKRESAHGQEQEGGLEMMDMDIEEGEEEPPLLPSKRADGGGGGVSVNVPHWRTLPSDIDALIWVTGAYAHAHDKESFCASHMVKERAMKEVYSLAQQLARIIKDKCKDVEIDLPIAPLPPNKEQGLSTTSPCASTASPVWERGATTGVLSFPG